MNPLHEIGHTFTLSESSNHSRLWLIMKSKKRKAKGATSESLSMDSKGFSFFPKSSKEILMQTLKLSLGLLLVVYVFRSKMIDFHALGKVLSSPLYLTYAFLFMFLSAFACSLRWYFLIQPQNLIISFRSVFSLTMIGNFFNTFLPGSVGGDVVKAWYIAGRAPEAKTRAIFTVLMDRILGLIVILMCGALAVIFFQSKNPRREIQMLSQTLWIVVLSSVVIGAAFWWAKKFPGRDKVGQFARKWSIVSKVLDAAHLYSKHIPTILISFGLTAVSIIGQCFMYKILGDILNVPLSLSDYFFIVPVAVTVTAVPLLPGGIGLGQVAFFTLFQWCGVDNPELGATLCTWIQIYTILFSLFGIFFYANFKRKVPVKAMAV